MLGQQVMAPQPPGGIIQRRVRHEATGRLWGYRRQGAVNRKRKAYAVDLVGLVAEMPRHGLARAPGHSLRLGGLVTPGSGGSAVASNDSDVRRRAPPAQTGRRQGDSM